MHIPLVFHASPSARGASLRIASRRVARVTLLRDNVVSIENPILHSLFARQVVYI